MTLTFGQTIAKYRKQKGYSQKQLASMLVKEDGDPISPQYLNDIERDRRNPPGSQIMEQLAGVLKVDKDWLYYLAGQLPHDLRGRTDVAEDVVPAFKAFRRRVGGGG